MKKTILSLCLIIIACKLLAQWVPNNDNIDNYNGSLFSDGQRMFCIQGNSGVFVSDDDGETWKLILTGMPSHNFSISGFCIAGNRILLSMHFDGNTEIYSSYDSGNSWTKITTIYGVLFYGLYFDGTNIYTKSSNPPIYISSDLGYNWVASSSGITDQYMGVKGFCETESAVFIYSSNEIYKTENHGSTWTKINIDLNPKHFSTLFYCSDRLILINGLYNISVSYDNGNSWSQIEAITDSYISSVISVGSNVFVGTEYGKVYKLLNNDTWQTVYDNYPVGYLTSFLNHKGYIYAAVYGSSDILRTQNEFSSLERVNFGLSADNDVTIDLFNNQLYAATSQGVIFTSDDLGQSWGKRAFAGIDGYSLNLFHNDTAMLWGTSDACYYSTDSTESWNLLTSRKLYDSFITETNVFIATGIGIFKSPNINGPWTSLNNDLTEYIGPYNFVYEIYDIDTLNNFLFIATDHGLYKSEDFGNNWIPIDESRPFNKLVNIDNKLIAVSTANFFVSNADGSEFNPLITNLPSGLQVSTFYQYNDYLLIGSIASGVFLSNDYGNTWINIGNKIEGLTVNSFEISNGYIFVGTSQGVWKRPLSEIFYNINETVSKMDFNLYPNPTESISYLYFPGTEGQTKNVTLFNLSGQVIQKCSFKTESSTIDLSEFKTGIYFVRISSDTKQYELKLIKL